MKTILTITEQDINPSAPSVDTSQFRERAAARAVLEDAAGHIYLLNVSKHGYHKLPGGGIDEGESTEQALQRELLEEVGCSAQIIAELGSVVEFRYYDDDGLRQTSYCYLAKQIGEQQASALEEGELDEGMFEVKVKDIDAAIELLSNDTPDNVEGKFIQKRDLYILQAAKAAMQAK
jgi:8-oxo-dGTP diphosphatase